MPINTTKVRTWTRLSDNDGIVFNNEFDRAYNNVKSLRTGLAKSADYTILNTDHAGLIRASNAVAAVAGKTFNTADPVNVASVGHGLVSGDMVLISASSAIKEVGNLHYEIVRVNDDNFTLNNVDNTAGAGGTLTYTADVKITLPAAADQTDQRYTVQKVDAATTGSIWITDGTTDYILEGLNDIYSFQSDGTNWILLDQRQRGGPAEANAQPVEEFMLPDVGIDMSTEMDAVGAGAAEDVIIAKIPENTVAVLVAIGMNSGGGASNALGLDLSPSGADRQNVSVGENDASVNLFLQGTYWIKTKYAVGAGEGRIIRAKKFNANVTVDEFRILGYKTTRI